jgi:hypothetical protein
MEKAFKDRGSNAFCSHCHGMPGATRSWKRQGRTEAKSLHKEKGLGNTQFWNAFL